MKKKSRRVDPLSPGHHVCTSSFGTPYGYTVRADGSIELPPGMVASLLASHDRRKGLEALLNATNAFVAKEMEAVEKARVDFWQMLDAAIPALKIRDNEGPFYWSLDHQSRVLRRVRREKSAALGGVEHG